MLKVAMILAAGRGERLRPLSDLRPKAMCIVNHIPLIEYHIAKLAAAGFERIVINHAYLGDQIRRHVGDGSLWNVEICYSPEPPGGLETGGGIVNALPLIGNQPFVTVNADIYTDYCFKSLNLSIPTLAHLVLVNKPTHFIHADFGLSKSKQLQCTDKQYTFTGIACYRPELFINWKLGRYSMGPVLRQLAFDQQATGELFQGTWLDVGSPEQLVRANVIANTALENVQA